MSYLGTTKRRVAKTEVFQKAPRSVLTERNGTEEKGSKVEHGRRQMGVKNREKWQGGMEKYGNKRKSFIDDLTEKMDSIEWTF